MLSVKFLSFEDPTKPLLQLFYECVQQYAKIMNKDILLPTYHYTIQESMIPLQEHILKLKK